MALQPVPRLSKLQQQRSRETRVKLVRAGLELWQKHGFDETTVAEICEAAGVSKGTFYFYFPRKEDLLLEFAVTGTERTSKEADRLMQSDSSTATVVREVVLFMARRTQRARRSLLARAVQELLASVGDRWESVKGERTALGPIFTEVFERARKRGELGPNHHPSDLASMLTVLLLQGMLGWAWRAYSESLEDVLWERAAIVLRGAGIPLCDDE